MCYTTDTKLNERAYMYEGIKKLIRDYRADRRRERWLAAKLEQLTDPTFLERATHGSR